MQAVKGTSKTSRYYSVDVGQVHVISLDLNVYYFDTVRNQSEISAALSLLSPPTRVQPGPPNKLTGGCDRVPLLM